MQKKKKIKFSIFFKLIVLFLIFIVLINFSLGFLIVFSLDKHPASFINKYPILLNQYVINDIGNPPDTNKARAISKELTLNLRYETSKINWTNDESVPTMEKLRQDSDFKTNEPKFLMKYEGRPYFINKIEDGYIIFSPIFPRDYINVERAVISIIILITVLAALLYFSLRWIFGPIKKLSAAVEQISEGNFSASININRKDELGNLSDSINEMKKSISNMIKAKESLLIDVSHELRSPLTRIKLANEFVENEKIKSKIRDDVKEMEAMITELLDAYKLEKVNGKFNKEPSDIIELIQSEISKFDKNRINFKSEFEKKIINVNKEKIKIVIRNILDNGIKYSEGKPVDVSVYSDPLDRRKIYISIRDKGNGIDDEEKKKIFEPFYRIDKSRDKKIKGYGLGLSLVKKLLNEHNASIEIKSNNDDGSEFIIHLPV